MKTDALQNIATRAQAELRDNILPYWTAHAPSANHDGFVGEINHAGEVNPATHRGMLLTSRILWTYAAAHRRWPDGGYLEMADRAYRDLETSFLDRDHGGYFWAIAADGQPLDPRKQTYGQSFAVYALSEYHRATGEQEALDRAIDVFRQLQAHARDRENGGFFELFSADWQRLELSRAAVMAVGAGSKTQNSHLHVMESFTNLLRVWPDPELKREQAELVGIMLERVLDWKTGHLGLVFVDAWDVVSDGVSYGHDIEAAWLMVEAAEILGDPALVARAREASVVIARATLAEGVDTGGALIYEGGPEGPTKLTRVWWPQAEAVVGFLQAWQVSGEAQYLNAAVRLWTFIEEHFVDAEQGGWFNAIAPDGSVMAENKLDLWTCPYHSGRTCMEVADRLG